MLIQDLSGRALAEEPITWLRVLRRDGTLEWRGQRLTGLRVSPAGGNTLRFQQRPSPGILEILLATDGLMVVNQLPLAEYLVGAVKAEAGAKCPRWARQAQAIVARA